MLIIERCFLEPESCTKKNNSFYICFPLKFHCVVFFFPGIYLASNGQGGLKSPTFTLNITHCVRFYYNFITSEMLTGDFTVSVDSFSSSDEPVRSTKFRAPNMSDTELWRMGQFELTPGKYQVIFQGYGSQVVSIDDVLALPGECAAQGQHAVPNFCCTALPHGHSSV